MTPEPIGRFAGDYAFLSNFHSCAIDYPSQGALNGRTYPSVEHAFQAAKTDDLLERRAIARARTPRDAKRMGRQVALRPGWDRERVHIMRALVYQKFTRHTDLCERLLATVGRDLVEGNTWGDRFWGVCDGKGLNQLGHILMEVRAYLVGFQDGHASRRGAL